MMEVGKDFCRSFREGRMKIKGMAQGKLPAEGKKKRNQVRNRSLLVDKGLWIHFTSIMS